jgi:uncharacterized protein YpmB
MTDIEIMCVIFCAILVIAFITYAIITNRMLKTQDQEIERLQKRLEIEQSKEPLEIILDGKVPKFGDF